MGISAGSVIIAPDGSETKSGLAEAIYDAFERSYLVDTSVPIPGLPERQVPIKKALGDNGTRIAEGVIGYFHQWLYTIEQGLLVTLTNKTGAPSVKGSVVEASTLEDDAFQLQDDRLAPIGIVYENGVADGQQCRVVIAGIADVLLEDGESANRGDWLGCAATDGRAYSSGGGPPVSVAEHFREVGHCLRTAGPGTDILTRAIIHFL